MIDQLAADLRHAFPEMQGFSPRNLKYMRAFAAAWPDEEALAVVARIDEPTGDVVRGRVPNLSSRRVVNIDAFDFNREIPVFLLPDGDVGLAEDYEEVPGSCLFQKLFSHRKVWIHPRDENGELAVTLRLLGDVRVEGEAADDEQVEAETSDRLLRRKFLMEQNIPPLGLSNGRLKPLEHKNAAIWAVPLAWRSISQ